MTEGAVLVAGIGNIFRGDDGFGVEVIRQLSSKDLPSNVAIRDFGIRGFDLAYALMEPWDLVILVDAIPRGGAPGTLYAVDAETARVAATDQDIDTHGMTPMRAIELVRSLGGTPPKLLVIGCEPGELGGDEGLMGLSAPVADSVIGAVRMIEDRLAAVIPAQQGGSL